jgi:hypothetical protein
VPHRNAPLTETGRLRLARCVVELGWPIATAAQRFQVSRPTATRWARRYAESGITGMRDRSSRPHRCPRRTPQPIVRKVVHLRWKQRLGPVAIADRVGLAPSTVHRILVACRINRRWHVDRATGEPIRRYEADRPGELVHIDVKKLGDIPDGGGWRILGKPEGLANRQAHRGRPRKVQPSPPTHRTRRPAHQQVHQPHRSVQLARLPGIHSVGCVPADGADIHVLVAGCRHVPLRLRWVVQDPPITGPAW